MLNTKLSPDEYKTAQGLIARMLQPLSASELEICRKMSVSPEAFKSQRDDELAAALPGAGSALTETERDVCAKVGVTESDFAAAKRAGG